LTVLQGLFALNPRKVAIVGGGPTRRDAPYGDCSWEIWGFSSHKWRFPRVTRWFEIHHLTDLKQQLATRKPGRRSFKNYMHFMRSLECPVYMAKAHPKIPQSVTFPLDRLLKEFGRCFTSTASYLVALAILEGYDVIGLWGIDPTSKSYSYQRPTLKYLLAIAKQRGIRIVFPPGLRLKIPDQPRFVRTRVLYAYGWRSKHAWWRDRVRKRLRKLRKGKLRKKHLKRRRR